MSFRLPFRAKLFEYAGAQALRHYAGRAGQGDCDGDRFGWAQRA